MVDKLESYYKTLGLRPGASPREVRQAYIDLARVWHPDRFTDDPRLMKKVEAQLREINGAYEHLCAARARQAPQVRQAPRLAVRLPAIRLQPIRFQPIRLQPIRLQLPTQLPMPEIMAVLILVAVLAVVAVMVTAYHQLTTSPVAAALLAAGLA